MRRLTAISILAGSLVIGWFTQAVSAVERRTSFDQDSRAMLGADGTLVILEQRTVQFFDRDGKRTKSRQLRGNEFATLPDGGAVVGITRYFDNSPSTISPAAFELLDVTGKRLYSMDKPKFSSVVLSPTGSAVVGIDGAEGLPQSVLRFYDDRGNETDTLTVEYFQGGRIAAGGGVFVFSTAKDGLLACSVTGQVIARYVAGTPFDLSADGTVLAVAQDSTLRVYADGKRQIAIQTGEPARAVAVSRDGRYVGWAGATRAVVYAVGFDRALTTVELAAPGENFRSLAISDNGRYFAVGVDTDAGKEVPTDARHIKGRAAVYDLAGRKVLDKVLTYQLWNSRTPSVAFTHAGQMISITTREDVYFLELPASPTSE